MKIIALKSENVKRLKAVEIKPDGSVVVVGGANGAGKSSVLDSIMYALAGGNALPEKPVRRGQEKAEITLDLGEYIVKKTIKADGSVELKVKTAAGVPQKSPQGILDALCGNLAFDPTEFARMKPQDQVELLKTLAGLDFKAKDDARAAAVATRTEVGRVVKQLEGQLQGMPYDETAPKEPQSAVALQKMLGTARETNRQIYTRKAEYSQLGDILRSTRETIQNLENQLVAARAKDLELCRRREQLVNDIEAAAPADEAAIVQQLDSLVAANATVAANKAKEKTREDLKVQQTKYEMLTEKLAHIDQQKAEALAAAKFPVESLSFDESGVLVNRVPFNQASAAEQLRVSLAMGMALNPKLRIMIVRDGSLLDDNSMAIIADMAQTHDFQCWIERVGEADENAVIIEDGAVK